MTDPSTFPSHSGTFGQVTGQVVRAGEAALAARAGVGLLPGVSGHVTFQMTRQTERLPTLLTGVGS